MKRHSLVKFIGFIALSIIYMGAVVTCDDSAIRLHIGDGALSNIKEAWFSDALPWSLGCLLSFAIPVYVSQFRRRGVQVILLLTVSTAVTVWLVLHPIAYSLDILRYLWDGRLVVHGVNPYTYVPADPHLTAFRNWYGWSWMGWKNWPEAYPPLAQDYFGVIAFLTNGSILQYKLLLLINAWVSIVLFYVVLGERKGTTRDISRRRGPFPFVGLVQKYRQWTRSLTDQDLRRFGCFVLFPPLLVEAYGAGHVDAFAIPWLLFACLCRLRNQPGRMGVAIAMATAIKVYPIVFFAALWTKRDRRGIAKSLLTFLMTLAILYIPYVTARGSLFSFFGHVSQMDYNGSIEYLLVRVFGHTIDQHSTLLVFVMELTAWGMVWFTRAYDLSMETKMCLLGLTFVLASPVVHPWYLLPLLPFAILGGEWSTLWLSMSVHFTYDEVVGDMFLEYVPTYFLYLVQWISGWKPDRGGNRDSVQWIESRNP